MEELQFPEDKSIFKISEAATMLGVKPHVLRYWETEFTEARPRKSYSGQRVYHREDVERIREIRDLLYKSKYSIEGARQVLKVKKHLSEPAKRDSVPLINEGVSKILMDHQRNLNKIMNKLSRLQTKVQAYKL